MPPTPLPPLPYDPTILPREIARHYIPATAQEMQAMLSAIGLSQLDELFAHIPAPARMVEPLAIPAELGYADLYQHIVAQSQKNRLPNVAFLGDGLPHYTVPDLVPYVAGLRELMTAYTPYQPERSQGTAPQRSWRPCIQQPVCRVRDARIFCCSARSGHRIWRSSIPCLSTHG